MRGRDLLQRRPVRPRSKYDLDYYLRLATELEATGAHIIGIKDMGGLCKPEAARRLVTALKREDSTARSLSHPRHERNLRGQRDRGRAGRCDAIDGAMDAWSG